MRVVGRYFAIGATLGSVSALVALVLIWTWMTVHLGVLGFLLGWIPAGLAAAALWLAMALFWGPILIVGALMPLVLLALHAHAVRHRSWETPPAVSEPETPPAADADAPREADRQASHEPSADTTLSPPPPGAPPLSPPPNSPENALAPATPGANAAIPPPPQPRSSDDLGGDAAAAGDTSHKPPT